MRKLTKVVVKENKLVDVVCDCCGKSCASATTVDEYETAQIVAAFNEGDVAGDRFTIEICQQCFFDFLEWFLLDKKGVVEYHNIVDKEKSADLDDLRLFFAHRRAGTLPVDSDEDGCGSCEESDDDDDDEQEA